MPKVRALLLTACLLTALLAGCNRITPIGDTTTIPTPPVQNENTDAATTVVPEVDFSETAADMFTNRDRRTDYDPDTAVRVNLDNVTSGNGVAVEGTRVTLTADTTYILTGTLADGMLVVSADENAKPHLIFDGVHITNKTGAALYILEADKVVVTLAAGADNTLANGGSFVAIDENNIDGAVFSKQDLTFNGTGALTVTSPTDHGIVCKDDLVFTGGTYTVNAASHGLDVNDSVRITAATLTIDAGKDAIHTENEDDAEKGFVFIDGGHITAEAEGDGIFAGAYMHILDGTIDLLVDGGSENGNKTHSDNFGDFMGGGGGGGRPNRPQGQPPRGAGVVTVAATATDGSTSMKGLKSTGSMRIAGGQITINAADDALHTDATMQIDGGTFTLATGDDALHAETKLTVTAGKITVTESYEGLEAQHVLVQGGEVSLVAGDDGINAAGGADQSGTEGGRDGMFGGGRGPMGGGNGSISITGGTVKIEASGDGLDANGTLAIGGGHVTVAGPTQGDTATLDFDTGATITGGTFIGTGADGGMAQTFSAATQGVIAVRVGQQTAGTRVTLTDQNGNTLLTHEPPLGFAVVIVSCPAMKQGETYTLTVGTLSAELQAA